MVKSLITRVPGKRIKWRGKQLTMNMSQAFAIISICILHKRTFIQNVVSTDSAQQTETWVFIVVGVVLAVVLGAGLIACSCLLKRGKYFFLCMIRV